MMDRPEGGRKPLVPPSRRRGKEPAQRHEAERSKGLGPLGAVVANLSHGRPGQGECPGAFLAVTDLSRRGHGPSLPYRIKALGDFETWNIVKSGAKLAIDWKSAAGGLLRANAVTRHWLGESDPAGSRLSGTTTLMVS